jgi:hypothetical protein
MLSISSPTLNRRSFLSAGSLALGGLTLPHLLAAKAAAASRGRAVRDKAVIFVYLHGGPSQTETFDPKMTAPAGVRSVTGEIPTSLPGVTFGSTFERLAALADQLAIVRSYRSGNGNHDIKPIVCKETLGANMGSLYARVAGTNHPANGMPTNAAIFPRAVDDDAQPMVTQFGKFTTAGELGNAYAPFVPGGGGAMQENMQLKLPTARLDDRRSLLTELDRIRRTTDANGSIAGLDHFQQQAFQTILGGVSEAFDLTQEDPSTLARYDTAPLVQPDQISRKWNNYPRYVDNAKTLGKLLLLARRMVERGCGFVTVTTNFVWDMHSDSNNAGVEEGMRYTGGPLDYALSALIEDLHQRGLSDKVLVVATGEMGRTPKVSATGGRNHWGGLTPLLLSGGGLQMGQVIGHSTADAGAPQSEPVDTRHLLSTIMHTLLDPSEVRLMPSLPSEVTRAITSSEPIPGLM